MRAYGDVHKAAAVRWGIYLVREGSKLYVKASGNNTRGIPRTPAYWDAETLELRLIDVQRADEDALDEEVLAYVHEHAGEATSAIAKTLKKRPANVRKSLERLSDPGRVDGITSKSSADLGTAGIGQYWYPLNQAPSDQSQLFGTSQDGSARALESGGDSSHPSPPRRGDESPDESVETELAWR